MPQTLYSPADQIDKYNKIVQDRGYDFFSSQAKEEHKKKYGDKTHAEVKAAAKQSYDDFMAACNDINHRNHAKAYNTLTTKFGSDPDAAFESFHNDEKEKTGKLFEQLPYKDAGYEKRTLVQQKPEKITNGIETRQFETLRSLLSSKWAAVGYAGDDAVINEYNREYCHK